MEAATERLNRAWVVLDNPVGSELASFALEEARGTASLRAALDAQGRRHLLVPHRDKYSVSVEGSKSILSTSSRSLTFDGMAATYVDVVCHDPSLRREFDQVCLDILEAYTDVGPVSGAAIVAHIVHRWRRLLRTIRERGLSPEEKIGLFAELCLFRSFAVANTVSSENWTGPERRPHDFEFPTASFEVKGQGLSAQDIVVHGLDQLEELDTKPLYLVLIDVEQDDAGERLADVVAELEQLLDASHGFRVKLSRLGFNDGDESRYALGASHLGRVTGDFPRLVAGDLAGGVPAGLSRVSYHVDRGALMPFLQPVELAVIPGFLS